MKNITLPRLRLIMTAAAAFALGSFSFFGSTGYANSVLNPGAENDLSGWNTSGSDSGVTLSRDTVTVHSGTASFRLDTSSSFTRGSAVLNDSPNWITNTPAGTCSASAWVKASVTGLTARIRLREYNNTTLVSPSLTSVKLSNTGWQQISISRSGVAAGDSVDLNIYGFHMSQNQSLWIDDITLDCQATPPANSAPAASLSATPSSGTAPLDVTADASASTDPDNNITSYSFDFGDGISTGQQATPFTGHTYSDAGNYTLTVTVTDVGGLSGQASRTINVSQPLPQPQPSADTLYVDKNNSSCTNSGTGTADNPYCSISAGAAADSAGQTLIVHGGTYSESVNVGHSGTSSSPIVIKAADGELVTVTGGSHGFSVSNQAYVTISGFNVTATTSEGIYISGADHITISGNKVSYTGLPESGKSARGIRLNSTSNSVVTGNDASHCSNSAIYIASDSPNNIIKGNQANYNASLYIRQANGIDNRGNSTVIDSNVTHDNEDSGIEDYPGGAYALVVNNVTYNNGDHGIDNYNADHIRIFNNTVYKNVTAGINLEGSTASAGSNSIVENNISVDNGINSPRTSSNIRVDSLSISGTIVDFNVVYLSTASTQYIWGKTSYSSLASFKTATGQEQNGTEGNPGFVNQPAGNFNLSLGSNAIDNANSGLDGFPAKDNLGNGRYDDLNTPNSGNGTPPYADRGAFEFQG